jgi:hypothetical protein
MRYARRGLAGFDELAEGAAAPLVADVHLNETVTDGV